MTLITDQTQNRQLRTVLSIPEVAEELGVSKMTIYRLLQSGQLFRKKIGNRSIIQRVELDRFLDAADTSYPSGGSLV